MPLLSQRLRDANADRPFDGLTYADRPKGITKLVAFNLACKREELEVAALLLIEYERLVTRLPISLNGARRTEMTNLVDAHAKLWALLQASNANDPRCPPRFAAGTAPLPDALPTCR